MTPTMTDLGPLIQRLRKQAGLTQDDLGAKVGATGASVSHWESGKHPPNIGNIRALADFFGDPELLAAAGYDDDEYESLRRQLEQQAATLDELRRIVADLQRQIEGS